jgi:hypothetical protein
MADVALDRLLRQVEAISDLAIDESLRDELKNLDLAGSRRVLPFRHRGPGGELDQLRDRRPASRDRLESARVLAVAGQDLFTLRCVHMPDIGAPWERL